MVLLLVLVLLQAVSAADVPLRSGCSPDDRELTRVSPEDAVQVEQALAGGEQTCYKVRLTRAGKDSTGYLLGETAPAVAAFVQQRQKAAESSLEAQARQAAEAAAAAAQAAKSAAADKSHPAGPGNRQDLPVFQSFSGRDMNGKPVSLAGVGGRVVLVTFWSPRSRASTRELLALQSLYYQFKSGGLRAIGISADPQERDMLQALDDIIPAFPLVPDRYGLTKRYAADGKAPTTLLLDASHRIVATGLTGPALEKKIRELLAE
jgi:peroxiredoxin